MPLKNARTRKTTTARKVSKTKIAGLRGRKMTTAGTKLKKAVRKVAGSRLASSRA